MDWKIKVSLALIVVLAISNYFSYHGKKILHQELIGQKQKYHQLSAHAASLGVEYMSQKDLIVAINDKFSKEKNALKGNIKILSNQVFQTNHSKRTLKKFDVENAEVALSEISYENGPPLGYIAIYRTSDITSEMYKHEISVNTVVSKETKTGKYTIISKADFILKEEPKVESSKKWFNKPFPLNITKGTAMIDPTEEIIMKPEFYWWNPKFNLSVAVREKLSVGVSASLMGYGVGRNDLDFKIVTLGLQKINDEVDISIVPFSFRPVKKVLPNTYLGIGKFLNSNWFLGLEVSL